MAVNLEGLPFVCTFYRCFAQKKTLITPLSLVLENTGIDMI
jgi:hypothetical protein